MTPIPKAFGTPKGLYPQLSRVAFTPKPPKGGFKNQTFNTLPYSGEKTYNDRGFQVPPGGFRGKT